jgi:hypothetical protein
MGVAYERAAAPRPAQHAPFDEPVENRLNHRVGGALPGGLEHADLFHRGLPTRRTDAITSA